MPMSAKFPGTCTVCGKKFAAGASIEWERSSGARHAKCAATSPRSSAASAAPAPVQPPGTQTVTRRSRSRDDNYEIGDVLHLKSGSDGGGPDGRYWIVVGVLRKWKDDDTDEWMTGAYVRPATNEECAERVGLAAAKDRYEAALATAIAAIRAASTVGDPRLAKTDIPPLAWRLHIAGNSAFSKEIFAGSERAVYAESSWDDGACVWDAPMLDAVLRAVAELQAAAAARGAKNA